VFSPGSYVEVEPAYGRDYRNQKDLKADWNAGLDFRLVGGPYINKEDAQRAGLHVIARYAQQRKVVGLS
jgi:hypothetical protein